MPSTSSTRIRCCSKGGKMSMASGKYLWWITWLLTPMRPTRLTYCSQTQDTTNMPYIMDTSFHRLKGSMIFACSTQFSHKKHTHLSNNSQQSHSIPWAHHCKHYQILFWIRQNAERPHEETMTEIVFYKSRGTMNHRLTHQMCDASMCTYKYSMQPKKSIYTNQMGQSPVTWSQGKKI